MNFSLQFQIIKFKKHELAVSIQFVNQKTAEVYMLISSKILIYSYRKRYFNSVMVASKCKKIGGGGDYLPTSMYKGQHPQEW